MKHKRFEENILVDEAYTNYDRVDKNADEKKGYGIAKHFADTLEYEDKKKWYQQMPEEPSSISTVSQEKIEELRKEASSALHGDTLAYETKSSKSGSSDQQWARTLLSKGTIGDRVAAATILIQDNPIYNLTALRNLINNVKPAKKKDGIVIIDALSELLVSELLIPDTKLRTFEQHPLGHVDEITSGNRQARRSVLKLWYYEDQLKELYGTYVEALNKFAHDSVEANKEKAVSAMSYLLMHHPEREKMLLMNIINKLGDPSQAVASKVIYHLCQLLYNHPNMKAVVLGEIERMLFRTNISPRAQYYGVCFLNQFYLGKDDARIAENLIRIYFSFFKAAIKKGEIDSRLMSAILTGVKRAYPYAEHDRLSAAEHTAALHRLVHLAPAGVAVHALALLHLVCDASQGAADRYYTALYRKLSTPDIFNTTHSALLFSLVYKSLKKDGNIDRVTAFVKRLLQLCCYFSPAQACGMMFLISQVLKANDKKEAIKLVWTQREVKEEIKDEKETEKKEEDKEGEVLQDSTTEVDKTLDTEDEVKETKKIDLLRGDKRDLLLDDDEETYVDLKMDDEGNIKPKRRRPAAVAGWYHARVRDPAVEQAEDQGDDEKTKIQLKKTINMDKVISAYDPLARNPAYAGAACSAYVELAPLSAHYHPSVRLFAEKLLHDQIIQYTGDPLKDFAGIRFLDRFVFKNPKRREEQPAEEGAPGRVRGSHPKFAVRKNYSAKGIKSVSVTSFQYLSTDAQKIPVDEKFLYDFLQRRREQPPEDADSDADSVTSDDFEQYLDNMTGKPQESDEELDYLGEMEAAKQKKPKKKGGDDDEAELSEQSGDDDEGSDGELDMSGDDDEPAFSGDEDELQLEDSDDDDDQVDVPGARRGKKMQIKGKDNLGDLFASAEEFSTLLEETATNKKQGSSQAVSNTDNSSTKQLAWEDKRDRWIKGYNKKILGQKGKKFNRKPQNKMADRKGNKMADKKGNKMADRKGGKRKMPHSAENGGKRRKK